MKTTVKVRCVIDKVDTEFGTITETGGVLSLAHDDYGITIFKKRDGTLRIELHYRIRRPCHDHDNYPCVILEIPPDGVVMCNCGKHKEQWAKLILQADSGYLMSRIFYRDSGWSKPKEVCF